MARGKTTGKTRLFVQALWTAVTNGYAYGFVSGKIYTGRMKTFCVPGLSCYSCPGALGSCPVGALQAVLDSRSFAFSCYIFGILMVFGSVLGRFICGWLCPFGLVQDLMHRIPLGKKWRRLPGDRWLRLVKYGILIIFVIVLPSIIVNVAGIGRPWFCQYICPSGTLMGGIPLMTVNPGLRGAAGALFSWKIMILCLILFLSVKMPRPFCRYLCPLGAVYGIFNPVAFYRLNVDREKCISCGKCREVCPMDIKVWETPNSPECIRCGACTESCPVDALEKKVAFCKRKCYHNDSALACYHDSKEK